jgi:uncharacterized membrane protein
MLILEIACGILLAWAVLKILSNPSSRQTAGLIIRVVVIFAGVIFAIMVAWAYYLAHAH